VEQQSEAQDSDEPTLLLLPVAAAPHIFVSFLPLFSLLRNGELFGRRKGKELRELREKGEKGEGREERR